MLCLNCHAQTPNFRNRGGKKTLVIEDVDFIQALKDNKTIHAALKQLGLSPTGTNYIRARELITKYTLDHLY